jgi:hypothetical protein
MQVAAALQEQNSSEGCRNDEDVRQCVAGHELVCTCRSLLSHMQLGAALQYRTAEQSNIGGTQCGAIRQRVAGRELVCTCRSLLIWRWGRRCSTKQQ